MSTRIYLVKIESTKETKLIDAVSHWQAVKHAVGGMVKTKIANAKEVAELVGRGVKVESTIQDSQTIQEQSNGYYGCCNNYTGGCCFFHDGSSLQASY